MPKLQKVQLDPCILVIFGATGDLTKRKLYPALYNLYQDGALPERFAIVSVGRREKTTEEAREDVINSIKQFSRTEYIGEEEDLEFLNCFHYFKLDFYDSERYTELKAKLEEIDQGCGTQGNRVFFLAVAPEHFATIALELKTHGMAPNQEFKAEVVIENPSAGISSLPETLNK